MRTGVHSSDRLWAGIRALTGIKAGCWAPFIDQCHVLFLFITKASFRWLKPPCFRKVLAGAEIANHVKLHSFVASTTTATTTATAATTTTIITVAASAACLHCGHFSWMHFLLIPAISSSSSSCSSPLLFLLVAPTLLVFVPHPLHSSLGTLIERPEDPALPTTGGKWKQASRSLCDHATLLSCLPASSTASQLVIFVVPRGKGPESLQHLWLRPRLGLIPHSAAVACDAFCTGSSVVVLCGALWCSVFCSSVVVLCAMFPCFSSGPGIPSDASRQAHLPGNSKSKSHHIPTKSDQVDSRSIKSACLIGTV